MGEAEVKKIRAQMELGLTKAPTSGVDPQSAAIDEEDPSLRDSQLKNKRIKTIKRKYGKKGPKGESPVLEKKESEFLLMQYIERATVQNKKTTFNLDNEVKKVLISLSLSSFKELFLLDFCHSNCQIFLLMLTYCSCSVLWEF
jgi:hypothetical protein